MNRNILLMLLLISISGACNFKKVCSANERIVGRYINDSESDADHYLELKTDSTFYHSYLRDSVKLENIGVWSFDVKRCQVVLSYWKSFGKYSDENCLSGCSASVLFRENELIFSYDLDEMNFKKK